MALRLLKTTVGKKVIMAVTGFILFGFVAGHLAGNLQVFISAEKLNAYAAFLKANPLTLWGFRLGMLAVLGVHVITAALLTLQGWQSRIMSYENRRYQKAGIASRTMRWTGPLILLFVAYHLLHLTTGTLHSQFSHTDVFGNVLVAFASQVATGFYVVAVLGLGLHLSHGVWSMLQSVGVNSLRANRPLRLASAGVSLFLFMGFASIPLAVALGLFK